MDPSRVDSLAKLIGSGQPRRRVLKTLAGGALASAAAAIGLNGADAAKLRSVGNACKVNSDCASKLCVQEAPGRKICHCVSGGDCPTPAPCFSATCIAGVCGNAYSGDQTTCPGGVCFDQACCTPESHTTTCSGKCGSQTNNCGQTIDCGACGCVPDGQSCDLGNPGACCSRTCCNFGNTGPIPQCCN